MMAAEQVKSIVLPRMCGVGWGVGALVLAALMQLRQHLRIVRGGS
eukprot:COSAG04_NODE_13424_length_606_cov_11.201183_1_plen_44_part_10